jgi:plastocyanin
MLGMPLLVVMVGSAHAEAIQIRIENLAFTPAQISAHLGDTIEWMNADFVAHTATARNGAWDVMVPPNTKKSIVLRPKGRWTITANFIQT